jgi:hypothetical protein
MYLPNTFSKSALIKTRIKESLNCIQNSHTFSVTFHKVLKRVWGKTRGRVQTTFLMRVSLKKLHNKSFTINKFFAMFKTDFYPKIRLLKLIINFSVLLDFFRKLYRKKLVRKKDLPQFQLENPFFFNISKKFLY